MSWELEMQTGTEASLFSFQASVLPPVAASLCIPTVLPLVMDLLWVCILITSRYRALEWLSQARLYHTFFSQAPNMDRNFPSGSFWSLPRKRAYWPSLRQALSHCSSLWTSSLRSTPVWKGQGTVCRKAAGAEMGSIAPQMGQWLFPTENDLPRTPKLSSWERIQNMPHSLTSVSARTAGRGMAKPTCLLPTQKPSSFPSELVWEESGLHR